MTEISYWGATQEAILKPSSKAQNRYWIKLHWRRYGTIFRRSH